jgi:hypothetical protein
MPLTLACSAACTSPRAVQVLDHVAVGAGVVGVVVGEAALMRRRSASSKHIYMIMKNEERNMHARLLLLTLLGASGLRRLSWSSSSLLVHAGV